MFLDLLTRRNPALIADAIELHQSGLIPANSYVIDLDAVEANARLIAAEAKLLGLTTFAMTKQFGRNPVVTAKVIGAGIDAVVAVDVSCARPLARHGLPIGHVGHLAQVPRYESLEVAKMSPWFWTAFNDEHARWAAEAARQLGRNQKIIARIYDEKDGFYPGHEGGYAASSILKIADAIDSLAGASFAGITTFPALLFDAQAGTVELTENMRTISHAASLLQKAGRADIAVNSPGTTSTQSLALLADAGATQVEPGHALTGTTPWHAVRDLPELPAMLYLSEVSHEHGNRGYFYGGGLYSDPVLGQYPLHKKAIVGRRAEQAVTLEVEIPPATAIDYYGQLILDESSQVGPGDTVVLGHRIQAFVARAFVVPIGGVGTGAPSVHGIWTVDGVKAFDELPTL